MFKSLGTSKGNINSFIIDTEEEVTAFKDRINDHADNASEQIDLFYYN